MISINSRKEASQIIKNIIAKDTVKAPQVILKLGQEGKFSQLTSQQIANNDEAIIDSLTEYQLCLLYKSLKEYNKEMPSIERFFTTKEISDCELLIEQETNTKYPFVFDNCRKIMENFEVYRCDISYQDLYHLLTSGAVEIQEGLQRETVHTVYKGKVISHVKFNNTVPPEISNCILNGTFFPTDEFKFHLLNDEDSDFEIQDGKLIVNSGTIYLTDGQHRSMGLQMAYAKNPNINLTFSLIFSYGSEDLAKMILAQHEKRQPIDKKTLEEYENSDATEIFRRFSSDSTIQKYFTFVENQSAVSSGLGFIFKSDMIKAVEKYYVSKNMERREKTSIVKWLSKFFMELYDRWESDFNNYKEHLRTQWNVNSYAYDGLLYLSKIAYQYDNNIDIVNDVLDEIDLSSNIVVGRDKQKTFKKIIDDTIETKIKELEKEV